MKKFLPVLLIVSAVNIHYAFAQSGLTYNGTFTTASNAIGSDPVIFTSMDGNQNLINAGTFGGTVDFNPGPGVTNVTAPSTWSTYLQKFDLAGNLAWVKSWGATGTCQPSGIATLPNGDILVAGYFSGTVDCDPGPGVVNYTSPGGNNPYLCKYDANGNFLWAKHLSSTGNAFRSKVYYDAATAKIFWFGHFAGGTMDIDPGAGVITLTSAGGNDGFCVELNAAGNYTRHFQIGSTGSEIIYDVKTDMAGNIMLLGAFAGTVDFDPSNVVNSSTAVGQTDGFLATYTNIGSFMYVRQFGGPGFETCVKLKVLPSGDMYVGGILSDGTVDLNPGTGVVSFNNNNIPTFFIVQLDNLGNYSNSATFVGGDAGIVDFAIHNNGNLIVSGYYKNTLDFDPSVGTQLRSSVNASTYDEYLLQLSASLSYIDVRIRQSITTSNQYGFPTSLYYNGTTLIRSGTFAGTSDMNILPGVDNRTAVSSYDYYVSRASYCSASTFGTISPTACAQYTSPSGHVWTASGTYSDTIENVTGCDSIISVNLTITAPTTPTLAISASSDSICAGDAVTFTATATHPGLTPVYAWYKNGNFQGNGSSLIIYGLANQDEIYATLVSSESCVTNSTVTSDTITMVVGVANSSASLNIVVSPATVACSADTLTFTANYFNGGNYPTFNWTLNSTSLSINSSVIQVMGLNSGDQITCNMVSSDGCLTNANATSNTITMTINPSATPIVSISGTNAICAGDTGVYNAVISGGGSNPMVNWFINSSTVPVASGLSFSTSSFNNLDTLRCVLINNDVCAVPNFDISNSIIVAVGSSIVPTLNITSNNSTACQGETILFSSTATSEGLNPTYQWYVNANPVPSATNPQYSSSSLNDNDDIQCIVTSSLSCASPSTASSNYILANILQHSTFVQSPTICFGDSYTVGNTAYTNSGSFIDTLIAANGCDSIVTTNLTVQPSINTTITQSGATLTVAGTGTYQWIDCNSNQPIPGATSQSYLPAVNGTYAVIVTANNCSDTSNCIVVLNVGMDVNSTALQVCIFPNPSNDGLIRVNFGTEIKLGDISVTDALGQVVLELQVNNASYVDLQISGTCGVYFLQVKTNNQVITKRVIKN